MHAYFASFVLCLLGEGGGSFVFESNGKAATNLAIASQVRNGVRRNLGSKQTGIVNVSRCSGWVCSEPKL